MPFSTFARSLLSNCDLAITLAVTMDYSCFAGNNPGFGTMISL